MNNYKILAEEFKKLGDTGKNYLEKAGYIKTSTFVSNNPYQSAFNEGRRSLALQILALIDCSEEDLNKLKEYEDLWMQ